MFTEKKKCVPIQQKMQGKQKNQPEVPESLGLLRFDLFGQISLLL